jgi:hypothetical protein
MKRNVGRLAEGFFQQLCDDTPGLACNRSLVDERGWDFLVEFPAARLHSLPLDMQPSPLSAFVQVKSTESRNLSCRVKLSNALRFALRPDPCFLVFFTYDFGKRDPTKAYLQHFWSPLIEQTIKAVRESEAQGRTDLHSIKIPIRFDVSHRVEVRELSLRMREMIAEIGGSYANEKASLSHFSGIDDGLGHCGLEFAEGVTDDDLVDLALGLRPSVPVKSISPQSKRFGISLPLQTGGIGPAQLSIEVKPASSATLVLSSPDSEDIVLPVEIYAPSAMPWIKQDRVRYRIKNSFIDFIFHPKSLETGVISITLPTDRNLSMRDFDSFLKLIVKWRGKEVYSQVWVQNRMMIWGTLQVPAVADGENVDTWSQHLRFLQHFLREAPRFAEEVNFNQTQMIDASEEIHAFLSCAYSPNFNADGMGDKLPEQGAIHRILYPVTAQVGEFAFCCLVSRMGQVHREKAGRVTLSMGNPNHLASYVLRTDDGQNVSAQLLSDLERRAESFRDEVPVIILPDPVVKRERPHTAD